MQQQNQQKQLSINTRIDAPTNQYPKRQFVLEGLIGSGSLGPIYLANPVQWGINSNKVALKFECRIKEDVKQLYSNVIEHQNKFEIVINQNCDNISNFIRIYDCFDYLEYVVTVMEIGQIHLERYLKQNQNMTLQQKQSICLQILQSIKFLHSLNLIHRDIKPEHYLMIDLSVKLVDFGLIKKEKYHLNFSTEDLFNNLYQSPESFEFQTKYTTATDVWSLACIFYEIMKGTQLFKVKDLTELRQTHQNQFFIYQKIEELLISDVWKQTMKRMLNLQPSQRISCKEAMELLTKKSSVIVNQRIQQPNFVIQQQFPQSQNQLPAQTQVKQFNQEIQQFQVSQPQSSIFTQLTTMISDLDHPNNINQFQQQKEQSIKLLVSLKDKILKMQNQLENNTTSVQPINSFDSNQENKQQLKQEIPSLIQQRLDVIKKSYQELEEKCFSIQDEEVLNQNFQRINEELEIFKNLTQQADDRQKKYQEIQQQVDILKEKQKAITKQKIVAEELSNLQNQNQVKINVEDLQKQISATQLQIIKLEQQIYTINSLQDLNLKQVQTIEALNQQIQTQTYIENELKAQKDEILELKVKLQYLELYKPEIQMNEKIIQQLKTEIEIQKLLSNQQKLEDQQNEIQVLNNQLKQLKDMEVVIKNNRDVIVKMKFNLKQQSNLTKQAELIEKDIENLQSYVKQQQETQKKIEQDYKNINGLDKQQN